MSFIPHSPTELKQVVQHLYIVYLVRTCCILSTEGRKDDEHSSPASSVRRMFSQQDTVPNCGYQKVLPELFNSMSVVAVFNAVNGPVYGCDVFSSMKI